MMFSIIIPAHNSENYIRNGLKSIAMQTLHDYELIVVCDKCTDNTEQIAREYATKVECADFGKDGLARDKGIEMAQGDWLLFMDDDDWFIHEFVLQILADTIEKQDYADIIAFGYFCKSRGYCPPSEQTIFNPGDAHVWSNCWKRSAVTGAKFGDASFCSDTYFIRDVKQRTRRYFLLDFPMYYYNFLRPGSQTDLLIRGQLRSSNVAR